MIPSAIDDLKNLRTLAIFGFAGCNVKHCKHSKQDGSHILPLRGSESFFESVNLEPFGKTIVSFSLA